jgi:hypothetical protein
MSATKRYVEFYFSERHWKCLKLKFQRYQLLSSNARERRSTNLITRNNRVIKFNNELHQLSSASTFKHGSTY